MHDKYPALTQVEKLPGGPDALTESSTWSVDSWLFHFIIYCRWTHWDASELQTVLIQIWWMLYDAWVSLCLIQALSPPMVMPSSQVQEIKRFTSGMCSAKQGCQRCMCVLAWATVVHYGKSFISTNCLFQLFSFFVSGICIPLYQKSRYNTVTTTRK